MNRALQYLLPGSTVEEVRDNLAGYYAVKGRYRGYWFLLETNRNTQGQASGLSLVTINVSFASQEQAESIRARVQRELQGLNLPGVKRTVVEVRVAGHSLELVLPALLNRKKVEGHINPVLQRVISILEQEQVRSGCVRCGNPNVPVSGYFVNGATYLLCDSCAAELENQLMQNQAQAKSRKGNLVAGVVGAVLGGLIGVALWFGVYQLGYLAAICGLVMAVCSLKGYELLGKHLDRRGIVICCVVLLAFTFLAVKLCWSYELYSALQSYGYADTFSDCFIYLEPTLEEMDLTGDYYGEMVLGYLFTALGAFGMIRQSYRSASGSYQFKKQ